MNRVSTSYQRLIRQNVFFRVFSQTRPALLCLSPLTISLAATASFTSAATLSRKKSGLISEYEYAVRHPDTVGSTSSIRIKIDPVTAKTFEDLKLPPALVSALHTHFPEVKVPTVIQRNMLALLQSDLSVLVRSNSGTGKSLAIALYLLAFGRGSGSASGVINSGTPGPHITSLLLVPTAELVTQYYRLFCTLLKDSPVDVDSVVQRVYRTDEATEARQLELLNRKPGPMILVATPKRVLDILASADDRAALPLNALSTIVLDEVHQLLPNDRRILAAPGRGSRLRNTAGITDAATRTPTQILLDHVVPWRNKNILDHNELFMPLRFVFASSVASGLYKHLAIRSKWLSTRPMLGLGLDGFGGEYKRRLPADVENYFVTYDQSVPLLRDTNLAAVDADLLRDETFLASVADLNVQRQRELLREGRLTGNNSTDSTNKSTDKVVNKAKATRAAQLTDYARGLVELMKANFNENNNDKVDAVADKKGVVIVPESFSIPQFAAELWRVAGIRAATSNTASATGLAKINLDTNTNDNPVVEVDPQTVFIQSGDSSSRDVDVLIYRANSVAGLNFPGLRNVYVLSWDSLLSTKLYLSVAGRCHSELPATVNINANADGTNVTSTTNEITSNDQQKQQEQQQQQKITKNKIFVLSLANEESKEHAFRLGVSMGKINSFPEKFFD